MTDSSPEARYRTSFERSLKTVKEGIPLERYAATLTDLKAFGRGWWVGRCPKKDHEDRTPSFFVYPAGAGGATAHAHCFGCNFHGDLFDLFQACEGGELWEAMMELSRRFGVDLPQRTPSWFAKQKRQRPMRTAIEAAHVLKVRRRLYRRFFEPLVLAIEDEADREHDARLYWELTERLAAHLVGSMMGGRR